MHNYKKINVLHLLKNFEIGGIESSVIKLANYLYNKTNFFGIVGQKGFYLKYSTLNNNIKVYNNLKNQYNLLYFFKNLFYIIKICKQNNVNIIHFHFRLYIPYIFFIKLFLPKIKIIYTHHSIFNDNLNKYIFANYYLLLSELHKQNLIRNLFLRNNYSIIPNGVSLTNITFANKNPLFNIGYVGRFDKIKGIDFLIKTFVLHKEELKDYTLILRGSGVLEDEIEKSINEIKNIKIDSPKLTLEEIYKNIGILIIPSSSNNYASETLPNIVMMEAMMLKIPVIIPDNIYLDSKFEDGKNVTTYKNNDPHNLIEKIKLLSTSPQMVNQITTAAYNTLKDNFTFEKYANSILTVYQNILNSY